MRFDDDDDDFKLNTRRETPYNKQLFIFYLLYKQTNDDFLDCFPKISEHFLNISKDSPKVVRSPDNCFRVFPNI